MGKYFQQMIHIKIKAGRAIGGLTMMYPFMQLDDNTEIVHSEWLAGEKVKVYVEKPVEGGFKSATCFLPGYKWDAVEGFTVDEIGRYQEILESTAHLINRFAKGGGFENAASF